MNATLVSLAERQLAERQKALVTQIREHLALSGDAQLRAQANQYQATDDDAVADYFAEMELSTLSRELQELRDIQSARERIRDRGFGICFDCADPIDPARLSAYPTARRCLACQQIHERLYAGNDSASL